MRRKEKTTATVEVQLDEVCHHCLQTYVREEAIFCADCDCAICVFCVQTLDSRIVCVACAGEQQ